MYYKIKLKDRIRVPPKLFEMERDEAIRAVLREEYSKTINKDFGLIIDVTSAKATSKGVVIPGDPNIYYDVDYDILTFSVEINEVFRGRITEIMEFGAFVNIGPFEGLLHISQISKDKFTFNKKNKTLSDIKGKRVLKKGDIVFVKCSTVSMRGTSSDVKISLTMRGDGLGKLEWLEEKKEKKKKKEKEVKKK